MTFGLCRTLSPPPPILKIYICKNANCGGRHEKLKRQCIPRSSTCKCRPREGHCTGTWKAVYLPLHDRQCNAHSVSQSVSHTPRAVMPNLHALKAPKDGANARVPCEISEGKSLHHAPRQRSKVVPLLPPLLVRHSSSVTHSLVF